MFQWKGWLRWSSPRNWKVWKPASGKRLTSRPMFYTPSDLLVSAYVLKTGLLFILGVFYCKRLKIMSTVRDGRDSMCQL